jgi:vacuolar-type H+-ATPase subunit E/Vma4
MPENRADVETVQRTTPGDKPARSPARAPAPTPDSSLTAVAPFVEQIEKDAEAEIEKTRGRAELAARRRLEAAEREGEAAARQARQFAEEQARRIAARAMAGVSLEVRRTMLRVQGGIVNEVLDRAREKLKQLQGTPQYADFVKRLAVQGILALGDDTCVLAPAAADAGLFTPQRIAEIKRTAERLTGKEINLTVSNGLTLARPGAEGYGVRVYSGSKKTLFDNTLTARLERLTDELRMIVSKEVFDRPLPDASGGQGTRHGRGGLT